MKVIVNVVSKPSFSKWHFTDTPKRTNNGLIEAVNRLNEEYDKRISNEEFEKRIPELLEGVGCVDYKVDFSGSEAVIDISVLREV